MSRGENLNAFAYFEAVARRGSLTRAAEELSVSPSAVSQQVKLLEQQLGLSLFRRKGRVLGLTLEGAQLFQASSTALTMLRDIRRHLGQDRARSRLNLRVVPSFGVRWLGPRLSDFIARHPDWDLRVDAAADPTDFEREAMDLDIRYGTGDWSGLHARALIRDEVLPLCSPAYLATLPETESERLGAARLIDSARALCQWDGWLLRAGLEVASNRKAILMDRSSMAIQLALDGVGVVLESLAVAVQEVTERRLVPVVPSQPIVSFPAYWAVCPSRHLNRRPVRQFLDWCGAAADRHHAATAHIAAENRLAVDDIATEGEPRRLGQ